MACTARNLAPTDENDIVRADKSGLPLGKCGDGGFH